MFKKMTNNDLRVGDVVYTRNGNKYTVVADDNGDHGVINLSDGKSNGIEVGSGRLAVCGGNSNGGRDIIKVARWDDDVVPARNRLSESLKFLTGSPFTEGNLVVIWTEKDPRLVQAEAEYEAAQAAMAKASAALNSARRRYG